MIDDAWLNGKRALVMGLGRFGGGVGATRFLVSRGCDVVVTDLAKESELFGSLQTIQDLVSTGQVTLKLGGHDENDFVSSDIVVANPSVPKPWGNRYLRAAYEKGVAVTTEMRLGLERLHPTGFAEDDEGPMLVGVTGTAGKSTTCAMLEYVLKKLGVRVAVAGNIGRSVLEPELLDAAEELDIVVLEVSSAQLYWLGEGVGYANARGWRADVAGVTGFGPNHIDWHGSLEHYERSKRSLVKRVSEHGGVVLGQSARNWAGHIPRGAEEFIEVASKKEMERVRAGSRVLVLDQVVDELPKTLVPGTHNRLNACMAACLACTAGATGVSVSDAYQIAAGFTGLPNRLSVCGVWKGDDGVIVRGIDDSKCTTPAGVELAVGALAGDGVQVESEVVLVCGGYDKGVPLDRAVRAASACLGVLCIGATGQAIASGVQSTGGCAVAIDQIERLGEGIEQIISKRELKSARSLVVLLSPGCASWDQFTNFESRGQVFAEMLEGWVNCKGLVRQ